MEDYQNQRRPKWKKTKIENDQNGPNEIHPNWKTTRMEDNKNGRQQNGGQPRYSNIG